MLYIPSEWVDWPRLVGKKDSGKVELASYMIYPHPPKQGQISLYLKPQYASGLITTPASLFSSSG